MLIKVILHLHKYIEFNYQSKALVTVEWKNSHFNREKLPAESEQAAICLDQLGIERTGKRHKEFYWEEKHADSNNYKNSVEQVKISAK